MKNVSLIINAVLIIAVAALFYIVLVDKSKSSQEDFEVPEEGAIGQAIVYVNIDSLMINYEYARLLSEELIRKEEASIADFNERARVFQQDMMEFQRKVQNDAFLSLERAQNEERRLRDQEQELQDLNMRLSNELREQQERMNMELKDTITQFLDIYCKEKAYRLVLSNTSHGDNVLYGEPELDITSEVVTRLNRRYDDSLNN
ncbi:OmpH family outer membrane protein [Marinilabiliaceae bacterium ANBcel2]|nr:OmpH family outer membrane protein [Marinilabiliaceae bacterium ANBcel2]